MSNEILDFGGKRYISSTRAASLVGYTKDYVGQLARAGKLEARLVGRNWYVSEDSIQKHKLSVHYTLTKPKKQRASETSNVEISIQNIDKSANTRDKYVPSVVSRVGNQSPAHVSQKKVGQIALRELTRSDIRYEGGESLMYDAGGYVPQLYVKKATPTSDTDTCAVLADTLSTVDKQPPTGRPHATVEGRAVSFRRPVATPSTSHAPMLQTLRSSRANESRVSVDGVVVGTEHSRPAYPIQRTRASVPVRSRVMPKSPAEQIDDTHHANVTESKRLSVMVAVASFILFCLWYVVVWR